MECKICGKRTEEEICRSCFDFYKWKYKVEDIDEVLEMLDQDRRNKNVEKTIQKKKGGRR
ncbi:MAG: hypothetical protein ABIJ18_01265 [archaeon]